MYMMQKGMLLFVHEHLGLTVCLLNIQSDSNAHAPTINISNTSVEILFENVELLNLTSLHCILNGLCTF